LIVVALGEAVDVDLAALRVEADLEAAVLGGEIAQDGGVEAVEAHHRGDPADLLLAVLGAEDPHEVGGDLGDVHRASELAELLLAEDHALELEEEQREAEGAALEVSGDDLVAQVDRRLPVDARVV
jgi:hypothetical protein